MIKNNLLLLHFFSSGNYSSTFKLRSRLAQFFKHVHPDQMNQAPPKIKQQNNLSLTNFNSYIDSINQQKPIEGKLLKFYIAEKMNHKSKKFFSFSLQLPQISHKDANMSQEKAQKLVNNIVDVLNKKFKQSQNSKSKTKIEKQKQNKIEVQESTKEVQTQQARVQRMASNVSIHKRQSQYREEVQDKLKSALNAKYLESQKDSLAHNLRKSISFADTSTNKSMMWSRLAMQEAGIYKDYQDILDNLIDPKLIYFDESLESYQIQEFKKKLLPGSIDRQSYKSSKIIGQVCEKMQSFDPPICFYVSTHYSGNSIPGFFTVPYNFVSIQLAKTYEQKIDEIILQREKYQQYHDYCIQLTETLKKQNKIYMKTKDFKGNEDIWSWILMLKRLQRYSFETNKQIVGLDKEGFALFKNFYKIQQKGTAIQYKQKLIILVEFQDADLGEVIERQKVKMM